MEHTVGVKLVSECLIILELQDELENSVEKGKCLIKSRWHNHLNPKINKS